MSNETQQKIPLIRRLRTYFLTGLVVAAPIAITIWVAIWFIESVDSWFSPFIPNSLILIVKSGSKRRRRDREASFCIGPTRRRRPAEWKSDAPSGIACLRPPTSIRDSDRGFRRARRRLPWSCRMECPRNGRASIA